MVARCSGGPADHSDKLQRAVVDRVLWAIARRQPLTWQEVATRFGVSRSTAFRWLIVLEEARQRAQLMEIPRGGGHRTPVRDGVRISAQ